MTAERLVRLTSDYRAGWPLWSADGGLLASDAFTLSDSLTTDLRAWQDLFESEFHWNHGWRTPEAEARYARAAAELVHRLRHEIGPAVRVTLDAWPVGDPELAAWLKLRH